MFCPRCGQQCVAETRFCPRCGLPLNVIAAVTANQGMAVRADGDTTLGARRPRQKGIRIGTILMLAAVALSPLFFALAVAADGPAPLLGPVTLFLTGLCYVLYARTFGEDITATAASQSYPVLRPQNNPMLSLPPERPLIGAFPPRRVNTSDMAEPPSVTDHTTQFFD